MTRYRVNLGCWEDFEEDEKIREKIEEAEGRIHGLANSVAGISGLSYKTEDLEEAQEVYRRAKRITWEIFGDDAEDYSMDFGITRQPECSKCGQIGRSSAWYCSNCGTDLITKRWMEAE
jgi:hypothetical protein